MKRWLLSIAALITAGLAACGDRETSMTRKAAGRVVVYTSVDRIFAEPVLKRAQERLGFAVVGVYDTEETKSTGLVNRLIAKKANPDGDIFWSGDPARAALLKTRGVTAPYDPPAARAIAETFKDKDRHWIGFSARTRVLLVNTELVPLGREPKSIFDFTAPDWRNRVAMANPLFGTTSFHVAAIFEALGEERARSWLDAMKANGVQIVASNGEVKRQVAAGQAAIGLTDSDDASEAIADGAPVRAVFLDQTSETGDPLGNLVIPNTISLIAGGPNPDAAKKVIDFLLTEETARLLADSCRQVPLIPGIEAGSKAIDIQGLAPMKVDFGAAADRLEKLMPSLKEWIDQK